MLEDIGVLPESIRYYHEADAFTTTYLYSVPHAGIYHCDQQYEVTRTHLDVCQIIVVDAGLLSVEYRGEVKTATAGTIVLLDCREPHSYRSCSPTLRMRWFHFIGCSSAAYTQKIISEHGFVLAISQNAEIETCCNQILTTVGQNQHNPHTLSITFHKLLAFLATLAHEAEEDQLKNVIQRSADYIEAHFFEKDLTIESLARMSVLSSCYYLRKFKEYQASTPHQFLQSVRLRFAKKQLTTTSRSIEDIAEQCGFCNTSHFVMTFRKHTGITPLQFRTLWK